LISRTLLKIERIKSEDEAFTGLKSIGETCPDKKRMDLYNEAYVKWEKILAVSNQNRLLI